MKTKLTATIITLSVIFIIFLSHYISNKETKELLAECNVLLNSVVNNEDNINEKFSEFINSWKEKTPSLASIYHHSQLENIEISIFRAEKAYRRKDLSKTLEELETASFYLEKLTENDNFSIENIF